MVSTDPLTLALHAHHAAYKISNPQPCPTRSRLGFQAYVVPCGVLGGNGLGCEGTAGRRVADVNTLGTRVGGDDSGEECGGHVGQAKSDGVALAAGGWSGLGRWVFERVGPWVG